MCVCVCPWQWSLEVKPRCCCFAGTLLNFWERVFYWDLRIIDEARLAGQRTPGLYLSLPTQCWDYKQMPSWSPPAEITSKRHHTLLFIYIMGDQIQVTVPLWQSLNWVSEPSSQPGKFCFMFYHTVQVLQQSWRRMQSLRSGLWWGYMFTKTVNAVSSQAMTWRKREAPPSVPFIKHLILHTRALLSWANHPAYCLTF